MYNLRKRLVKRKQNCNCKDSTVSNQETCSTCLELQEEEQQKEVAKEIERTATMEDALVALLKTMVTKPVTEVQPSKFGGQEGESIIDWLNNYDRIAACNKWEEEKQTQALPLYLDKSALIYYESLPDGIKQNQVLLKEAFKKQYNSVDRQWALKTKLYAHKQEDSLSKYIDELEQLCQELQIQANQKMDHFINGLKPYLKEAMLMKQPKDYNAAVAFARLKDSTKPTHRYEEILSKLDKLTSIQDEKRPTEEHKTTAALSYNNPVESTREIARLREEVRRLKTAQVVAPVNYSSPVDTSREIYRLKDEIQRLKKQRNPFKGEQMLPNGRNLRTSDGQVICNTCHRVGHVSRTCRDKQQQWRRNTHQRYREDTHQRRNGYTSQPQYSTEQRDHNGTQSQFSNDVRHKNYAGRRSNIPGNTVGVIEEENPNFHGGPITIEGRINGIATKMLVDSGAVVTLISNELYKQLSLSPCTLIPGDNNLITANGKPIKIFGELHVEIMIEGLKFPFLVKVAENLSYPTVIGIDFLRHYKATIDFVERSLYLGQEVKVALEKPLETDKNVKHATIIETLLQEKIKENIELKSTCNRYIDQLNNRCDDNQSLKKQLQSNALKCKELEEDFDKLKDDYNCSQSNLIGINQDNMRFKQQIKLL